MATFSVCSSIVVARSSYSLYMGHDNQLAEYVMNITEAAGLQLVYTKSEVTE
jgi:hypothetical protein